MSILLLFSTLFIIASSELQPHLIEQEITNTQDMILLYQQKLTILQSLYKRQFPHLELPVRSNQQASNYTIYQKERTHSKLLLINKFNNTAKYLPDHYLLNDNKIINIQNGKEIAEFIGDPLIVQDNKLTTLVSNKISMSELKQQAQLIKKQQYFLGLDADHLPSIWQRNYNLKDGEDLLIQWTSNRLYFRGKQVRQIQLNQDEMFIDIYSLNQYKIVFVSNRRIGTINARSLQIGESEHVINITKIWNSTNSSGLNGNLQTLQICKSYRHQNFIYLLLNTGQIAKYLNEKIVSVQLLPDLSTIFKLSPKSVQMQIVTPYLFIGHQNYSIFRIYNIQQGKLSYLIQINLPSNGNEQNREYTFFKQGDTYHLLFSMSQQSYLYEILIPSTEQTTQGSSYIKILGIVVAIGCFFYFKMSGKDEEKYNPQMLRRKIDGKEIQKLRTLEKGRTNEGLATSEIQEFLKRKSGNKQVPLQKQKHI